MCKHYLMWFLFLIPVNMGMTTAVPLFLSWPLTFWWSWGQLCCWRQSRYQGSEQKSDESSQNENSQISHENIFINLEKEFQTWWWIQIFLYTQIFKVNLQHMGVCGCQVKHWNWKWNEKNAFKTVDSRSNHVLSSCIIKHWQPQTSI